MLFEISPLLLVDEDEVQEVAALEPVVHVWICWRQIGARKIKPYRNTFTLDRCAVHNLEFIQVLCLSHGGLSRADNLLSYYTKLHMLDFDSHQIEVHFAQDAVFQVELALIKFEFDM